MNQFTIKDIENLCGIKAHTLRTWEKRHGLLFAKRKKSKHRIYDNDDLKELLRIAFLYHQGYKISEIATLNSRVIQNILEDDYLLFHQVEAVILQLLEAGIDLNEEKFGKVIDSAIKKMGFEKCIEEVLYPFFQRIGLLWMTNHIIPAQEHFVSHIIQKKILIATDKLQNKRNKEVSILIFSPTNEYHEIPLLIANYIFRKQGLNNYYFGTNVNVDTLNYFTKQKKVDYLYCHIITYLNNINFENYITEICSKFQKQKIIISGPQVKHIGKKPKNLQVIESLNELIEFANTQPATISA